MTKEIIGNWEMEKDEVIREDLKITGNITGKDGERYNLTIIGNFDGRDFNGGNFNGGNFDGWNFNGGNFDGLNFDGGNFDGLNFNGNHINFYAVFFCYDSIKCKSIKARRENARCFVLDGNIEIDGVDYGKEVFFDEKGEVIKK